MNGLIKKFVLAVLIGIGSLVSVQAVGSYTATVSEGNVVLIEFDDIQSEVAYVKLIDRDGVQLWSEVVRGATTFHKQFNLAQLPDGDYDIIMTDGDVVRSQGIRKSIDKVYVINNSVVSILKPVTTLINKKFKVTFPEGISKLKRISFQAEDGTIFFSDTVDYNESFAKAYNLKNLVTGKYTVILKTDQDTFYKEVTIK